MSAPTIPDLLAERVDGRDRSFGAVAGGLTLGELGAQGLDLGRGALPLPLLVLREAALAHNLAVMQRWPRTARPPWRRSSSPASSTRAHGA